VANTIRVKRSTGSSAPTSLANAEIAFAEGNEIGYIGIGTGGAGGSATTVNKAFGKGAFWDKDTTRTANTILSGPIAGSAASPTFRSLVIADLPSHPHTLISDFDAGVRTNRLDQMTVPTGSVSMNSQNITNLADPVNTQDAATKGFVEATAQGLDVKDSCVATTTANITISTALNNGDTLDGVSLSTGDRVLVKNQSTSSQNGIYVVGASPARAADLATGANAAGFFTFVEQGTVNAENGFVCTSDSGSAVVGTNNLTIAQFSGAGQITTADGLQKSGNTISVDLKANGGLRIESTEIAVNLSATNISGTLGIGDGGTGTTTSAQARINLGVQIGTDVEPHSDKLTELATMGQTTANSLADLTAAEVQILDGATLSTAELNYVDGVTSAIQTQLNNKQPLDAELTELATMGNATAQALADLTQAEVQILDGATVTTAELNTLDGITSTVSELNILDGVTATATEINLLDGKTITTSELNILDGNNSATATTLATADRFICNDNGQMKQVALSDLVTFLENESVSGFNIDGGTY